VLNANGEKVYQTNEERKQHFISKIKAEQEINKTIRKVLEDRWTNVGPLQQIYYGAPGTGKSCGIKKIIKEHNIDEKTQVIRTTFHPDSDYSTFVGAYKPTMEELPRYNPQTGDKIGVEEKIVYSFTPQAFLEAYVAAWKNQDKPVFLVIEELNRGNCAQIFGDIFQLLDRKDNGESEYPIKADQDIRKFLAKEFADVEGLEDDIQSGKVLVLPSNLYIWATMNTSDQSLFPIDSAFKRRWDWVYVPIKYANGNWVIEIGDLRYSWVSFQKIVNKKVYEINHSEDKMLGDFFVKANDQDVITEKVLINKILFYLWNDVCKDGEGDIFKKDEKTDLTFSDLYGSNGTNNLIAMMDYLGVEKIEDDDMDENDETSSDTQGGTKKHPKYSIDGSTKVYSTPKSVLKIINDFAQKNLNMSVLDMIKTWNRIANRNDFLIESWVPSPTDNSKTPRRTEITWNNKSVWVARGWTEELFQTFIENVKKELGIDIVKVN
jgi:5-methylcytosine-specific restriction endonuclease McrBC GTP-binding regulatory subunit McrB